MTKPCDYCGRTDWGCENEAQVIGCYPMPAVEAVPVQGLRKRLSWAIQAAEKRGSRRLVCLLPFDARAILVALQEADRREMQNTIDGDMPCS